LVFIVKTVIDSKGKCVFKNLMMYRLVSAWPQSVEHVENALQAQRFVPCGASQDKSFGWTEPRAQAHAALVEVVDGQWILKLMLEVKAVPAAVVKRTLQEHIAQIEASTGRKPGKKEQRELGEEIRRTLLPQAFSKQSSITVWVHPKAGYLLTDAGSVAKADAVMTALIKSIDGLEVALVNTQMSPVAAMAQWLATKEAPPGFSVDRECELKAADESKAVVRYTRHALDTDEVGQHIALGKLPSRLALTWNDRVSFVLTESLQIKKLAFLETVFESARTSPADRADDAFDADVVLATGELSSLIPDLIEALGGQALLA
jgi:recombination associated protein RdgC